VPINNQVVTGKHQHIAACLKIKKPFRWHRFSPPLPI
jgi:hypothetical protein